ncbi:cyanoexosortase B [Kamptonema animale CS-326]|jgi:cyanoexosortase B|uniref:cyanoexosortase B n=1 Tax=Kamptonema animale TaxID=92934 RepID=UPI00232E02E5|nr:cyanoexosortase B [Kamptonema animale]MDB9514222.1 cyanoexosortase B [Kamptonema animale CS-326]
MQIAQKIPIALKRHFFTTTFLLLLAILYAPLIIHWYDGWLNKTIGIEHEYFSHGLIGLPYALYIAWTHRHRWSKLPDLFHPLGAVLLAIAGVFYLSKLSDLVNLSFPLILAGMCLSLKGFPGFNLQRIPLLFVLLATPNYIPYLIEPYALPLQHFIATVTGFILTQIGLDVTVENIYLYVRGRIVEVAPHCAGLKMLFTSFYVSLMLLHWTGVWSSRKRSILFLSLAIILSITANILRNTLLTLFHGTGREKAFAWLHAGWGGDLYSACMLGMLVVILNGMEKYLPSKFE